MLEVFTTLVVVVGWGLGLNGSVIVEETFYVFHQHF